MAERPLFGDGRWLRAGVRPGEAANRGPHAGPAIIEQMDTTIVIEPGAVAAWMRWQSDRGGGAGVNRQLEAPPSFPPREARTGNPATSSTPGVRRWIPARRACAHARMRRERPRPGMSGLDPITLDPITLAVIQAGLQQVCDEMDLTFSRAAFSPVIAEADDRSDGIYATDGALIAQGRAGAAGLCRASCSFPPGRS